MGSNILRRSILAAVILAAIGGYGLYESRNRVGGPFVVIEEPRSGHTVQEMLIEVKGKTKNISFISIDDRQVTVDESGAFKEKVLLSVGYNIVKVEVRDRFDREEERLLEIVRKDKTDGLVRK